MADYTIALNATQLRIIGTALESYARIRMGQFFDLVDELAFEGFDWKMPEDAEQRTAWEKDFARRVDIRNNAQIAFNAAYRPVRLERKTPDMVTAIDMWRVIRHQFYLERPEPKDHWTVDAGKPVILGPEPGITVERRETDDQRR